MWIAVSFGTSRREMSSPCIFHVMTHHEKLLRCSFKVDYRCCRVQLHSQAGINGKCFIHPTSLSPRRGCLTRAHGDEASRAFYPPVIGGRTSEISVGNVCIEGSRSCLNSERTAIEERGVGDSALLYSHGDFPFPSAPPPILQVRQKLSFCRLLPHFPSAVHSGVMAKLRVTILEYFPSP
jgi:hypothetical protein